jgi:hypothetical protein
LETGRLTRLYTVYARRGEYLTENSRQGPENGVTRQAVAGNEMPCRDAEGGKPRNTRNTRKRAEGHVTQHRLACIGENRGKPNRLLIVLLSFFVCFMVKSVPPGGQSLAVSAGEMSRS